MTEPSGESPEKRRRPVAVPAAALVAFTAFGVTALLGGLNEAPEEPEPLGQGAVLDQGLYSTRLVESRVTVERAATRFDEDKHFVELVFDVTNKGDETRSVGIPAQKLEQAYLSDSFAGSLLKINPSFGEKAVPFTFVRTKGGDSQQLHPGVTSQVIVRYRLEGDRRPPEKISFEMASFELTTGFNNELPRWQMVATEAGDSYLPEVKARVTLPVKKGGAA
ncbi:hypothetical protein [Nonomuraea aridisoli]|uniref:hypothetical protein n=1 Tax=Nonomuraea aridisoli TaxID=2070368 RepID=UPI0011B947D7|nr:hypothetical protein [Nonomuraea aridisoli]